MSFRMLIGVALALMLGGASPMMAAARVASASRAAQSSPWDGDWVISPTRNPAWIKDAAADGYRFHLQADGRIRWEIPSLHEVVEGRTDGAPMVIHRPGAGPMTLAVSAEGSHVLVYRVAENGQASGEGRMTLVDHDRAWIDITQPPGRPDLANLVIYVRPDAAKQTSSDVRPR